MKKYFAIFAILFLIVFGFAGCTPAIDSSTPLYLPDFVKLNEKYYVKENTEIQESDIDIKIGKVETNSPKESCKWSPEENEASELKIGTEIYALADQTVTGVVAYVDGKYLYYDEVSEDAFYGLCGKPDE